MPEEKKHKRPEFKPPFPASPLGGPASTPAANDVLTNDADEAEEPVVVETVPEDSVIETDADTNTPAVSEVLTDDEPIEEPEKETGGPKFVSKSATTLTREPVTNFLTSDSEPVFKPLTTANPPKPTTPPPVREVKEIHTSPPPVQKHTSHTPQPTTHNPKPQNSSSSLFTTGIIVFSLIFGLAGWTLYFNTKFNFLPAPTLTTTESVPTESVTPTLEPSPTPTNNRASITLEVLNGSGVAGLAAKTAERLENLGYTVTSTGNADRNNYTTTQILTAPSFDTAELLLSDLTKEFDSASVSGELKDSTASARIIVGRDWAN